jgi:hypothetical protein
MPSCRLAPPHVLATSLCQKPSARRRRSRTGLDAFITRRHVPLAEVLIESAIPRGRAKDCSGCPERCIPVARRDVAPTMQARCMSHAPEIMRNDPAESLIFMQDPALRPDEFRDRCQGCVQARFACYGILDKRTAIRERRYHSGRRTREECDARLTPREGTSAADLLPLDVEPSLAAQYIHSCGPQRGRQR